MAEGVPRVFTINAQGPILYQDFVVIVEDERTTLDDTSFDIYLFIHVCTTVSPEYTVLYRVS